MSKCIFQFKDRSVVHFLGGMNISKAQDFQLLFLIVRQLRASSARGVAAACAEGAKLDVTWRNSRFDLVRWNDI